MSQFVLPASSSSENGNNVDVNPHPNRKVIYSDLPDGIIISTNQFGRCLVATKFWEKGALVYQGHYQELEEDEYLIIVGDQQYETNTVNSVKNPTNNLRQVYGFDGFMNHSCDPNLYCPFTGSTDNKIFYDSFAVKDIHEGDEITCDYALFDYECDGHEIPECLCGSPKCRGSMRGFKQLTLEQKVDSLPYLDPEVLARFLVDTPEVEIVDVQKTLPDGVTIFVNNAKSFCLKATKNFAKGELVFSNTVRRVTDSQVFVVKFEKNYRLVTQEENLIHREGYREFLGFDMFMNHSCDPSITQTYITEDEYEVYAARDIEVGDELTCDYQALHNHASGQASIVTIEFDCTCGSSICRGHIAA